MVMLIGLGELVGRTSDAVLRSDCAEVIEGWADWRWGSY